MTSRLDVEAASSPNRVATRVDSERAVASVSIPDLPKEKPQVITSIGLRVLVLLAVQNSSKNLLLRFVMKEKPKFLTSAAVIGSGT